MSGRKCIPCKLRLLLASMPFRRTSAIVVPVGCHFNYYEVASGGHF